MRDITSDPNLQTARVVVRRAHDLMLDYIKETTQGLSKMSMNRMSRATMEIEEAASEQQKSYARAFYKPALKSY